MPSPDFFLALNDTAPLSDTLRNAAGDAVNIRDATVEFVMRATNSSTTKVDAQARNNQTDDFETDGSKGAVSYQWVTGDTDTSGWFDARWVVTYADGRVQTFPNDRWLLIGVTDGNAASTHEYVTLSELKDALEMRDFAHADEQMRRVIPAASRGMDNLCKRRFWQDPDTTQTRVFTALSPNYVRIDDVVDISTFKTDDLLTGLYPTEWVRNTDYMLRPENADADGKPWTAIARHPNSLYRFAYPYPRTIQITGRFGWPTVPDPIRAATTILASKLLLRLRDAPLGVISAVGDLEGVAVRIARTDPDIRFLVEDYIRTKTLIA